MSLLKKRSIPVSLLKKSRRSALIAGSVCALGLSGVAFAVPASASASASASDAVSYTHLTLPTTPYV